MSGKDKVVDGYLNGRRGIAMPVKPGALPPEGAIRLNSGDIYAMRYEKCKNKPFKEVWPSYGAYIVAGTSWLCAAAVTYNIRFKLKLFSHGRVLCYGIGLAGPCMISGVLHDTVSLQPIMSGSRPLCPVCIPTKSACCNAFSGWLLPTVMSFLPAQHLARGLFTYPLPPITPVIPFIKEMNKVSYRIRPLIGLTFLICVFVPFTMSHFQQHLIDTLDTTVAEYEEQFHNNPASEAWSAASSPDSAGSSVDR